MGLHFDEIKSDFINADSFLPSRWNFHDEIFHVFSREKKSKFRSVCPMILIDKLSRKISTLTRLDV